MQKIISLILVLLFTGCASMPHDGFYGQADPAAMEKMMALLQETGANKIRAFTGRTGGVGGKIDSIAIASLANDDLGLVFDVSNSTMYFYKFSAAATDAENDPYFIRPDDYGAGPGVWYLLSGMSFARAAIPQWNFLDSGATDYDDNARIYVDCTDTGSGTEDCDLTIAVQIAGALTDVVTIDADGSITLTLPFQAPKNVIADGDGIEVSAAQMNSTIFMTGSGEVLLPDVCDSATGQWLIVYNKTDASDIEIEVADSGNDKFVTIDGTATDVDDYIQQDTDASTWARYECLEANIWYITSCVGIHTDGGAAD